MATLDKILDMQRQGISEQEIVNRLQSEGTSPKEIFDAINQARVKNAVSPMNNFSSQENTNFQQDMQPSIMPPQSNFSSQAQQSPTPSQAQNPQMYPPETTYPQNYGQNQPVEYYPQAPQAYDNQYSGQDYGQQNPLDTETISEVAEQVASEKINEFKKQVGDINLFKSFVQDKLSELDDRIRRIESSIDKIHHSVIGRVGEFGESSALIHKDLENLHGTVSKLMNPLIDNYHELKKFNDKKGI
jgi:hypothetical protein